MPGKPTRVVLHLEPGVIHPVAAALLGQGEGGEEVLEGHVPRRNFWEGKGVGLVGALPFLALDVVEAPGPGHRCGRGVRLLVMLVLVPVVMAVCMCACGGQQGCRERVRRMPVLA